LKLNYEFMSMFWLAELVYDRDARQFNPNYNLKGQFNPPLGQMSLTEIYKYDPQFAKELDSTLRFWRLLLSKSSPDTIEKLITYVQAADSFDKISMTHLSSILKAAETSLDEL
ncbi:MAG: hypothetical protein WCK98_08255, partial [bacterium]